MTHEDRHLRAILPIPDQPHVGLTTYDAKDPDTKFPPIEPLRVTSAGEVYALVNHSGQNANNYSV